MPPIHHDGSHPPHALACAVHASLRAGDTETRYVRAGAGPPVLLLHEPGSPLPLWTAAFAHLALSCRVIEPHLDGLHLDAREGSPTGRDPAFARWLSGFLDGLGSGSVCLVVSSRLGAAAARFARREPERVRRLVILAEGGPDAPGSPGEMDRLAALLAEAHAPA